MFDNDLWNCGYIWVKMIVMNKDENIKKKIVLTMWWGYTLMTKSK